MSYDVDVTAISIGTTTYFMINPEDNTVTNLPERSIEKDLGVLVDDQLTFKVHIATGPPQWPKPTEFFGVIRRSFQHLEMDNKSMVRPILEYGQSIRQPHLQGLRRDLENVQQRATRMVADLRQPTYPQRLEALCTTTKPRAQGETGTCKAYETKALRRKPAT